MATNSNISGYPPPYGIQSGAPFPQQQPVYTAMYPPVQMGYPQHPVYYPQYQQQPMIPNSNINIFPHDAILFYDEDKLYYELSNFAKFGFDLDGVNWPTSEHYFQAQKFEGNPQIISQVRRLPGPRDAFEFVRRADNRAVSYYYTQSRDAAVRQINGPDRTVLEFLCTVRTAHLKLWAGPDRFISVYIKAFYWDDFCRFLSVKYPFLIVNNED